MKRADQGRPRTGGGPIYMAAGMGEAQVTLLNTNGGLVGF
jgi:hypothetical protein